MFYTLYLHSPPKGLFLYMITYLIYIIFILFTVMILLIPAFIYTEIYDFEMKVIKDLIVLLLFTLMITYIIK